MKGLIEIRRGTSWGIMETHLLCPPPTLRFQEGPPTPLGTTCRRAKQLRSGDPRCGMHVLYDAVAFLKDTCVLGAMVPKVSPETQAAMSTFAWQSIIHARADPSPGAHGGPTVCRETTDSNCIQACCRTAPSTHRLPKQDQLYRNRSETKIR